MDKRIITRNFSRCACIYDRYADIQKKAALETLGRAGENSPGEILEIGCGTGNYTFLLRQKFKKARITALDISAKMVEVARGKLKDKDIEFIIGDGESVSLRDMAFDLVTSNACFQWFQDLEKALRKYKASLKTGGLITFSVFGPLTFRELNSSLESLLPNTAIASGNFMDIGRLEKVLEDNFSDVSIKEAVYEESFGSILELLSKIKYTGIRGNGPGSRISFNRRKLDELERAYLNKFGRIKASYQVFFCRGRAR